MCVFGNIHILCYIEHHKSNVCYALAMMASIISHSFCTVSFTSFVSIFHSIIFFFSLALSFSLWAYIELFKCVRVYVCMLNSIVLKVSTKAPTKQKKTVYDKTKISHFITRQTLRIDLFLNHLLLNCIQWQNEEILRHAADKCKSQE